MRILTTSDLTELGRWGEASIAGQRPQLIFGLSTCGIASGGMKLKDFAEAYIEEKGIQAEIVSVGCVGMCHAEPLVDVKLRGRPRVTYARMDEEKLRRVIDEHLVGGKVAADLALAQLTEEISVCERASIHEPLAFRGVPTYRELPFFGKQVRIVLRNCGIIDPEDIHEYIARGGYRSALKAFQTMTPEEVIADVTASGLRGRGGAGFPTGLKWQFARSAKSDQKYIICNADEGDPGAYMDRAVLEGDPHSVIEGMIIGSFAIGASKGFVYVRTEYPLAIVRLKKALEQAREYGLLGKDIAGSGHDFDIDIREGAGVFVCGEETALIASIEGKRGEPKPRPPFPAAKGLWGKPTNINNVETFANLPVILERGGAWFAGIGTEKSKGTKVFSLVGQIRRAGLVEVPMGIKMTDIIHEIGGGTEEGTTFKAVQTGGPSGGCVPASHLDVAVDYETLKALGSIVGSGGMVVLDSNSCMVEVARYFLAFTAEESCGKCTLCRIGTKRMLEILERITRGKGRMEDIDTLKHLCVQIRDGSLCALGGTAPNPVLTTLKYFLDEYEAHIVDHTCSASVCAALFRAPCQNTCPAGTDVPGYIQLINEKRYADAFELNRRDNPFPSVCGRVCDHPCEARCQRSQFDDPLSIRELKRFCADKALLGKKKHKPRITRLQPIGKKVAIVGGGPAGLSAAYFLARLGYSPTIFEASRELGGMLRHGIPRYRLPAKALDREIADILELGVDVRTETVIGEDVTLADLKEGYDAVFIAVGAQGDRKLDLEGEDLPGVHPGLGLLSDLNGGKAVDIGETVLVIGGGNVAVDVARSVLRTGRKVTIAYRREEQDMPAYREEIEAAKAEGVIFHFLVAPERIIEADGRAVGVAFRRMRMGAYSKWGRRNPEPTEEMVEIMAAAVVPAIGQTLAETFAKGLEASLIREGLVPVAKDLSTPVQAVFAGGDAVTGPASVIEAVAHGKRAARNIDVLLSGRDRFPELAAIDRIEYPMEAPKNETVMERACPKELAPGKRTGSFDEVVHCLDEDEAIREAFRCFRCDLSAGEVE